MIKLIGWLQLLCWVLVLILLSYLIFVRNSPAWYNCIKIGTGIQLFLLILPSLLKKKFNTRWLVYNLISLCFIGVNELVIYNILHVNIFKGGNGFAVTYLFIIVSICIYIFSINFIITNLRIKK